MKEPKPYLFAVGRRKEAVARVRLYAQKTVVSGDQTVQKGEILVNGKPIHQYFSGNIYQTLYEEPFKLTGTQKKFAVTIKVEGGGLSGQLDAMVHGLSKALSAFDPSFRSILKKRGLLTRDSRTRQRRKVGMGGKSRRKKQSPKR